MIRLLEFKYYDSILFSLTLCLMAFRSFQGIDFTDTSWYFAEPYAVATGSVPYSNNWSQAPGFTLPLALFFKFFLLINEDAEGIVLFSHLLFDVWYCFVILTEVFLLKRLWKDCPLSVSSCLLAFAAFTLYQINYNSIGIAYCSLIFVSVWYAIQRDDNKRLIAFLAGMLMSRTIIGTPATLMEWILLVIFLAYSNRDILKWFVLGNVFTAMIVSIYCVWMTSMDSFILGINTCVFDLYYLKMDKIVTYADKMHTLWDIMKPSIFCFILVGVTNLKKIKYVNEVIVVCAILSYVIAFFLCIRNFEILPFIQYTWYIPVLFLFFKDKNIEFINSVRGCSFFALILMSIYCFAAMNDVWNGFNNRIIWLYYSSLCGIGIFYHIIKKCKWIGEIVIQAAVIAIIILQLQITYTNVYREEPILKLDTKVESGIWKGCYTTEKKAKAVIELERFLKESTQDDDRILVLDWASFGYVMSHGEICSPTVLDSMAYSYGLNQPGIMYKYFKHVQKVPTKIIYIDYGRDEKLSIEDNGWKFNNFVNRNYVLNKEFNDELFRVKIYSLLDSEKTLTSINEWAN